MSLLPPSFSRVAFICLLCMAFAISTRAQGIAGKAIIADSLLTVDSALSVPLITMDTLPVAKEKKQAKGPQKEITPKRVALLGLACPGLGQIYNKKYWKLPIVYGLIGTGAFFTGRNAKELRIFNVALEERFDTTNTTADQFEGIYTTEELYSFRKFYQRNVELSAIMTGLAWGLQIVDAVVDAHLKKFDISDDLTLQVKPTLTVFQQQISPGIGIKLQFR